MIKDGDKEYRPYFSDNLFHDQTFAATAIKEMLMQTDLETGYNVVIVSDNCSSQYKSAKHFFDLHKLSNDKDIRIVRVYGIAGHSKNKLFVIASKNFAIPPTDSVGGIAKIGIKLEIACGTFFLDAYLCLGLLAEKHANSAQSVYVVKEINKAMLENVHGGSCKMKFPTFKGSSAFRDLIFSPGSSVVKTAPCLGDCERCLSAYGFCLLFKEHTIEAFALKHTCL